MHEGTLAAYENPEQVFLPGTENIPWNPDGHIDYLWEYVNSQFGEGPKDVWDIGGGHGRESFGLQVVFGGEVIVLDTSKFLLEKGRELVEMGEITLLSGRRFTPVAAYPFLETAVRSKIRFVEGDILNPQTYMTEIVDQPHVAHMNCVSMHFTEDQTLASYRNVYAGLQERGLFLVRLKTPPVVDGETVWTNKRNDGRFERFVTAEMLHVELEEAGFEVLQTWGSKLDIAYTVTSEFITVIARKPMNLSEC